MVPKGRRRRQHGCHEELRGFSIEMARGARKITARRSSVTKRPPAGNTKAMASLGWLYANGKGGAQDDTKAREWYQKAADAGTSKP